MFGMWTIEYAVFGCSKWSQLGVFPDVDQAVETMSTMKPTDAYGRSRLYRVARVQAS